MRKRSMREASGRLSAWQDDKGAQWCSCLSGVPSGTVQSAHRARRPTGGGVAAFKLEEDRKWQLTLRGCRATWILRTKR
jgi:hypothetical protein